MANGAGRDWFEAEPRAAYGAWLPQLGGSPAMRRYYENLLPTMYNRYYGALGTEAQGGKFPTQTFPSWLQAYPAQRQYQNLPGWMRGYNPQRFSPRHRWLPY